MRPSGEWPALANPYRTLDDFRLGFGVCGVGLLNAAIINMYPFLAGGMIDSKGLSAQQAGGMLSLELLIVAFVALALTAPGLQAFPRIMGVTGCTLCLAGNLLSVESSGAALAVDRALAGMGEGLALAAAGRAMATARAPARLAGYIAVLMALIGGALSWLAGMAVASQGFGGVAKALALVAGGGAAMAIALPKVGHARSRATRDEGDLLGGLLVIGAAFLVFLGSSSAWAFAERIGRAAGLGVRDVATAMAVTALIGTAGGFGVVASARHKRPWLAAGLTLVALGGGAAAFASADNPIAFIAALTLMSLAFVAIAPMLLVGSLQFDRTGGLAGGVQGAQMLAGGSAPLLGGFLLTHMSRLALAGFAIATTCLAVVLLISAARRSSRTGKPALD